MDSFNRRRWLFLVVAFIAAREVIAAKNRNLPVALLVLLLAIASALDHLGIMGRIADIHLGMRVSILVIVMLISLIGGRIVPSFTRNWMLKQGMKEPLPNQPSTFDKIVLILTFMALGLWASGSESTSVAAALAVAGIAQLVRLFRWKGWRTMASPIVVILHVSYMWIPIGLLLLSAHLNGTMVTRSIALHALTAGAMASMVLAVMTRASLGHTGRVLTANKATIAVYVLITLGAALRVVLPLTLPDPMLGLIIAAIPWVGAFILFFVAYSPILARPRITT